MYDIIVIGAGHAGCDLCASTGVHDGEGVVKQLLVGAQAVQVASALYLHGPAHIGQMLAELRAWMKGHGMAELDAFRGALSQDRAANPAGFERVQFMKGVAGIE